MNADLTPKGSALILTNGLIEAGNGRANITGQWQQDRAGDKTTLNIGLNGPRIDETLSFFGLTTLIKNASFAINADLNWRGVPWEPQINTLSGTLKGRLGKGQLTDLGGGVRASYCVWSALTHYYVSFNSTLVIRLAVTSHLTLFGVRPPLKMG